MQRYDEAIVVVKYGGHAMGDEAMARSFARDIVLLEQTAINPVVVHGGGPQIGEMLKRLGIKSRIRRRPAHHRQGDDGDRRDGARRLDQQADRRLHQCGGRHARSACAARTATWCTARKVTRTVVDPGSNIEKVIDLGFVGEPDKVDTTVLDQILGRELIPVLAPVATSADGETYNVNADTFAGAIAGALEGEAPAAAHRRAGRARQVEAADQGAVGRRCAAPDRRRHHLGRHDPEGRDLHVRARGGRRGRRHPRRQGGARGADRAAHRRGRRNPDAP